MQACLEAEQQDHHHRAGCGQCLMVCGQCQAAEQEGQQHGNFAGHALIAGITQVAEVAGHHQQAEYQQQGDPRSLALLFAEQRRQPAE
ncbi:hypothetical protein GCM10027514_39820 [Azotobacter armeniacus]